MDWNPRWSPSHPLKLQFREASDTPGIKFLANEQRHARRHSCYLWSARLAAGLPIPWLYWSASDGEQMYSIQSKSMGTQCSKNLFSANQGFA